MDGYRPQCSAHRLDGPGNTNGSGKAEHPSPPGAFRMEIEGGFWIVALCIRDGDVESIGQIIGAGEGMSHSG